MNLIDPDPKKLTFVVDANSLIELKPGPNMQYELVFEDSRNEGFQETRTLENLTEEIEATDVPFFDPFEQKNKMYRGISVKQVFDKIYGEAWRDREEIEITMSDCERQSKDSIPVQQFIDGDAILAYEEVGKAEFITYITEKDSEKKVPIELGSVFLIWKKPPGKLDPKYSVLKILSAYGWLWQVKSFKLIDFADRFPKAVAPPKRPTDFNSCPKPEELTEERQQQLKKAFVLTRQHCLTCHRINGNGEWLSDIDLNRPRNTIEKFGKQKIMSAITEIPSSTIGTEGVQLDGRIMPFDMMLSEDIPTEERNQVADDILDYLDFMKDCQITE